MSLPIVTGQVLIDSVNLRLGGVSGAFDASDLLDFINDGIGATWAVLKALGEEYFVDDTQSTTPSTEEDYIATIASTSRELDLPPNTREIRLIECTTEGYKHLKFEQRSMSDDEFQARRRSATIAGSTATSWDGLILFTVVGAKKLLFADYPPATLTLVVWRVTALNYLDVTDQLTEILYPFHRKVVDYATQKALLSIQRESLSDRWLQQWQLGVRELAIAAAPRTSTNAVYIPDYAGE